MSDEPKVTPYDGPAGGWPALRSVRKATARRHAPTETRQPASPSTWRPARILLGAYLFGGVTMLQFHLQGLGVQVPSQLLSALPYLATIVVLALISRNPAWIRVNMPASLGKPFHPSS